MELFKYNTPRKSTKYLRVLAMNAFEEMYFETLEYCFKLPDVLWHKY